MIKENRLEKLISEGSSAVYFSLNPAVTSNEIWTKENGLDKSLGAEPGEAVTLIGIKSNEKKKKSYFLHGVYEIIPFSSKIEDKDHQDIYKQMIPGVAYLNPISIGINLDDFNNLDKETGPVKTGNKEFLGVINLENLMGLNKGKINEYFENGAYSLRKPGEPNGNYIVPTAGYKVIKNVGQGAGLISSSITDKIADRYNFPRPKPGDTIVGIGYREDSVISYKSKQPYAFPLIVSSVGDRLQVPPDAIDSLYFEVIIGVENKLGDKLI